MEIKTQASVDAVADVVCDVCNSSTRIPDYGLQYGSLEAQWGYGSKHDGEHYRVHLCKPCFFGVLGGLRRQRMVNVMFDENEPHPDERFGLVSTGNYWGVGDTRLDLYGSVFNRSRASLMGYEQNVSNTDGESDDASFNELLALAIVVFGTRELATKWFHTPALGLSGTRPIDLLASLHGSNQVREFLIRLEHGVYQ
jgi:putative toxin-antitoxin system antitoxin component (TIGR02293 family)